MGVARRGQGDACPGVKWKEGAPEASAPRRGPRAFGSPGCAPQGEHLPCGMSSMPRAPGTSCPGAFGGGGGWTEPGAAGDCASAWSSYLSPPPRSSRSRGSPQPPPDSPKGGLGEKQPTEGGCFRLPRAAGTRAPASRPGHNGKEGEKRVKKLG